MSAYTDSLDKALNVTNEVNVSRRYECPVITFSTQHAHAFGHKDHHVDVRYLRDGKWWKKTIRLREGSSRLKESRAAHLEAAVEWAREQGLGVEEWVPTGFPNSWMPKDVKERMKADVQQWRKGQQAERSAP
ncbi:hypothetical protein [Streptomyces sp. NPDC018055]|uniref:hypothetical protein n=1 Tax=Streptomyces sp. NPDC018055 TaxID=3365038 RepID=UPI00379E1B0D